jgi:hypothetical protein
MAERAQTITLLNKANLMHLPRLTSVWRRRIERRSSAGAVEWWQRRRCERAASTMAVETGGVESAWQGHREFWDEKRNDMGLDLSVAVHK